MGTFAALAEVISTDTVISISPSKWFYGGVALIVFVLLVFVVTRLNIDR